MSRRGGAVSVAELLLVTWLFAFILLATAAVVARQGQLAGGQRDLIRLRDAARTTEVVLGSELRWLGTSDISAPAEDSISVRAVRGGGAVCGAGGSWVDLRYTGARRPDPAKDSVLLIHPGGEDVRRVAEVNATGECGPAGLRITLDRPVSPGTGVALVFERGSYHAVDGAVRYRSGRAGRQPLTEAVFGDLRLERLSDRPGVRLHLRLHPDSLPRAARTLDLPVTVLNPPPEVGT